MEEGFTDSQFSATEKRKVKFLHWKCDSSVMGGNTVEEVKILTLGSFLQLRFESIMGHIQCQHNALWQSGDMGEKCNKKVVNFGN